MIQFLLLCLIAHFVGDFTLQPDRWVTSKKDGGLKSSGFWKHIAVHAVLLLFIGIFYPENWWILLIILVSHIIFDASKIEFEKSIQNIEGDKKIQAAFFIDQAFHLLVIILLIFIGYDFDLNQFNLPWKKILKITLGAVLLSIPVGTIMKIILIPYSKEIKEETKSLQNAGKMIGILERLLVFLFILLGQWSAIGFLITAKSVFRFGDLTDSKNRQLTEYVLIGTLLSFGIAIATGILVKAFL